MVKTPHLKEEFQKNGHNWPPCCVILRNQNFYTEIVYQKLAFNNFNLKEYRPYKSADIVDLAI